MVEVALLLGNGVRVEEFKAHDRKSLDCPEVTVSGNMKSNSGEWDQKEESSIEKAPIILENTYIIINGMLLEIGMLKGVLVRA